jgi:hypothetical protein
MPSHASVDRSQLVGLTGGFTSGGRFVRTAVGFVSRVTAASGVGVWAASTGGASGPSTGSLVPAGATICGAAGCGAMGVAAGSY